MSKNLCSYIARNSIMALLEPISAFILLRRLAHKVATVQPLR
jgi:hypothetical protein